MKKTAIAAAFLAVSIMLAACSKPNVTKGGVKAAETSETTVEETTEETTEIACGESNPAPESANLFGNPDFENVTERGLIRSGDIEESWVEDLYGYTSVIEWVAYSPIVSGSEFTVEFFVNGNVTAGQDIKLYIFEKNDDYAWDTNEACAVFDGTACNTVNGETYWCKTILPDNLATGEYTLVIVHADGTVDSMMDIDIVATVDETSSGYEID